MDEHGFLDQPEVQLVSTNQLAGVLGVSTRTIYTLRAEGRIPVVKVATCTRYDVREVLEALRRASSFEGGEK